MTYATILAGFASFFGLLEVRFLTVFRMMMMMMMMNHGRVRVRARVRARTMRRCRGAARRKHTLTQFAGPLAQGVLDPEHEVKKS